uniref:Uncharacterized protein n=1 Tax=Anguilla anguilla TaxID=7936 RepID=A0A0E9T3I6_ANGAN
MLFPFVYSVGVASAVLSNLSSLQPLLLHVHPLSNHTRKNSQ